MAHRKSLIALFLLPVLLYLAIPLPDPVFPEDYSAVVLNREGEILRVFLNGREQWCLPPRADLPAPEKLKAAVLLSEDRYFEQHPGVNPLAVVRALVQNARAGEVVSGASTLTMQVARLMRPKPRTYVNKALEVLQALKLEARYSKEEILRLYLDHAPYGGNVVGVQAAGWRYFGKSLEQVTWAEAALLAVLPNAPGLAAPQADARLLREKRDRLLAALRNEGTIGPETFRLALLEPAPEAVRPFEMSAAHLAREAKARLGNGVIRTTLDGRMQARAEALVRRHVEALNGKGIRNGAALVAETGSGAVRAYVGSQDFWDGAAQGQVDGVRAPRSSGSLLKPFLYALCMDAGIALPQTQVRDVPSFYGAFSPHNANEKYSGLLTAREALVRSANVPAVRLLYTYGSTKFYNFLKEAGMRTLFRPAADYGLPLILGGAEVTLWDMARLFRGLGRGGVFGPLHAVAGEKTGEDIRLLSPGASFLTLEVLQELRRPGAEYYWRQYENQWPLAWKTGTSYGQRDAWAVGVSPQWTVAVWVGNFDGEGNPELAGSRCAGPLLFDLFNALPKEAEKGWFARPEEDLVRRELCAETGFLAGEHCPRQMEADAPRFMKPLRLCPFHVRLFVAEDGAQEVCSRCWVPGQYRVVRRLVYPPDVAQLLREQGQANGSVPFHRPDCPARGEALPLEIVYPQANARLWVPRDLDGKRQSVAFRVAHRDGNRTLFWYLDDRFWGESRNRHVKAAELAQGWHVLEVVDGFGNRARTRFYAEGRSR